jgi:hypothetical protein
VTGNDTSGGGDWQSNLAKGVSAHRKSGVAISGLPVLDDIDADYSPQYVKLARIIRDKITSGILAGSVKYAPLTWLESTAYRLRSPTRL